MIWTNESVGMCWNPTPTNSQIQNCIWPISLFEEHFISSWPIQHLHFPCIVKLSLYRLCPFPSLLFCSPSILSVVLNLISIKQYKTIALNLTWLEQEWREMGDFFPFGCWHFPLYWGGPADCADSDVTYQDDHKKNSWSRCRRKRRQLD